MTRDKLIEQESEKYADELIKCKAIGQHDKTWMSEVYKQTFNSQLANQLQELAVIEGLIKNNNAILGLSIGVDNENWLKLIVKQLETQRTELLTKLNLEE